MSFSVSRNRLLSSIGVVVACALLVAGCQRRISPEEKNLRAQLRQALQERSFDRATELARRVLRYAPQDNDAWEQLAEGQFGVGDLVGLHGTLDSWKAKIAHPSPKFDEFRGDLALAEGDRGLALQAWTKALAAEARNLHLWQKMARLEQGERRWAEAVSAWNKALKLQESAASLLARADCFRHLHNWDAAALDVARARQLAAPDVAVRRAGLMTDRLQEFLPQIKELDRQISAGQPDAALLTDRALLLLRADMPDLALEDADAALASGPSLMRPRLIRGLALIGLGRVREAEAIPVRPSLRLDFLKPEFLETMTRLDSQIAFDPGEAEFHVARAWQLDDIGQPALALQDAEIALRIDPKSAAACAECSYALTKLDRVQEAYDRIRRATDLDPNFATAWLYRGELEMRRVDYLGAIESFTRALALSQTVAALQKREACYRKVGLVLKAAQDHDAAVQLSAPSVH